MIQTALSHEPSPHRDERGGDDTAPTALAAVGRGFVREGRLYHSTFASGGFQEISTSRLVEAAIDQLYGLRLQKT